jgi:hypothetical protein
VAGSGTAVRAISVPAQAGYEYRPVAPEGVLWVRTILKRLPMVEEARRRLQIAAPVTAVMGRTGAGLLNGAKAALWTLPTVVRGTVPPVKELPILEMDPTSTRFGSDSGAVKFTAIERRAPDPVSEPPRVIAPPENRTVNVPPVNGTAVNAAPTPPAVRL